MNVLSLNFTVSVLGTWECVVSGGGAALAGGWRVDRRWGAGERGKDRWNRGVRRKGRKKGTVYSLISCQPPARAAENEFSCRQLMAYNINIAPLYAGSEAAVKTRDQLTLVSLALHHSVELLNASF